MHTEKLENMFIYVAYLAGPTDQPAEPFVSAEEVAVSLGFPNGEIKLDDGRW